MENTQSQKTKQKLVSLNQIPDEILGVKLSELDKEKLSYGEYTSLKEHFKLPNGSVKDGKTKLSLDSKGEIEFHFLFHSDILEIPEKIGGKKLSKEQIDDLHNGKTVLLNIDDRDLYLKVDKELNCVSISTGKEIGIPDEMGGYRLTAEDKQNLANNEPIGSRVYKGKDGYFIANVKLSKDNKEIIFMDIKSIDREKDIEKHIDSLNNKKNNAPDAITIKEDSLKKESLQNRSNDKTIDNAIHVAVNTTVNVNPDVVDALKNKNFKKLNMLRKDGKIKSDDVKYIKDDMELSKEDKSAALTILGEKENIQQQQKEFYKAVDEKNPDKIKELTDKGFVPEKEEIDYIINHKALKPDEKKEILSSLNVTPEEKQKSEIKIGKVEEHLKAEKAKESPKDKSHMHTVVGKIEKAIGTAFNDM